MKTLAITIGFALTSIFLLSCQNAASSKDALKETQLCLNTSVPSSARNCVSKISSDLSAAAYKLRCAAIFISEGYNTPAAFTGAFDQINSTGACTTGCSSTVNAINSLNFHSGTNLLGPVSPDRQRNLDVAAEAFANCSQSGANIYTQISSLFQIGTLASMKYYELGLGGATAPTQDQIKSALSSIDPATLGGIVTTTYTSTCSGDLTKATAATQKLCADLGAAVAGGATPAAIGACLAKKLANPAATCP